MMRHTIRRSRYDVIVVGARCAGATTAMLLARAGHRVLLIDRSRHGTDTLSTHALMRGAVVQLHRWHLLPDVIASGAPPIHKATFFYRDESLSVPVGARGGVDALYAPRRYVLDALLVDAAAASGRVTGVVLHDESGGVHRVSGDMVVGADGLRSTVARLVRAPIYRVGRHATATMYGHFGGLEVDGYEWYFVPGLSAGAIPTNERQVCVTLSVPSEEFTRLLGRQHDSAFRDVLRQVAPNLAEQVARARPSPLHGFAGQKGFFRRVHGPGWALVGDAGYFKDPLTAHGITDALRDAELLADAVDAGSEDAFADYEQQRDVASSDVFETTDAIASFSWDLNRVRVLHEALARAMSNEVKLLASADR